MTAVATDGPVPDPMGALDRIAPLADGLVVTVFGKPVTQGAIRSLGKGRPSVHAEAGRLKPWREAVKQAALDVVAEGARRDGPVSVAVTFTSDPPQSAPKRRRVWPITRSGDLDKLVRAVLDALTDAGVWRDDSQVVRLTASKVAAGIRGRCTSRERA